MKTAAFRIARRQGLGMLLVACLPLFSARIAGAAQPVESLQQQTEKVARTYLRTQLTQQGISDAEVTVTALPPNPAPDPCPQRFEISPLDTRYLARLRFSARCPGTDAGAELIVRADVQATVLVAAEDIAAGKPIGPDSVRTEKRSITNTPDALSNPADLSRLTARHAVRAGQVLQKRYLQALQLVRRNQSVRIVARNQQIEAVVPGIALDNGGPDDVIRVRNVTTGRTISARVVDVGVVAPAGTPPAQSSD
ncbi:flagellar basal body P-ring formation chaperone FlgA [Jeongeupia chitinilytica]|uniref:SAF domain-containing protein n=1 Tax=Jeongeupia chitinilytica TaxID=1041641 RepID=A0ABQ3GZU4_9NEIS|nr:flagellar basal body P-ring formation chaperone FlgA [Jeongeupia chitinilytica]GHD63395.1 hypothetical protein GCM10007350_20680 [Jeongeupia chitinilytica]